MDNGSITEEDFDKICRLCLSKNECLLPVFGPDGSNARVADSVEITIRNSLLIKVDSGDSLPKNICKGCHQVVESWNSFRELCKHSNQVLMSIISQNYDSLQQPVKNGIVFESSEVTSVSNPKNVSTAKKKKIKAVKGAVLKNPTSENPGQANDVKDGEKIVDAIVECMVDVEPLYECEICKQKFFQCNALFDHLRKQHKIGKPYECQECGKKYSTPTLLSIHEGTHTKPFQCDICLHKFANKQSLKAHKLYHEGGEKCDYCGKTCTSRVALVIHQRKHTGERPYTCHVCGKMFPYTKNLDLHMRTHNDDFHKDICDVCGYVTSIRSNFLKHIRRHSNERKHVCGSCGKTFVEKCGLNKHLRRHCKGIGQRKRNDKFDSPDFSEFLVPC